MEAIGVKDYDVTVISRDGSQDVIKVFAKHATAALRTALNVIERDWTDTALGAVTSITLPKRVLTTRPVKQ